MQRRRRIQKFCRIIVEIYKIKTFYRNKEEFCVHLLYIIIGSFVTNIIWEMILC